MSISLTDNDAAEIELTREVLALKSYDEAKSLIEGLNDAQWAAQQADNAVWAANRLDNQPIKRVGSIEFFEPTSILATVRNTSRFRFGLSALAGNATDADAENSSLNILTTGAWF